MTHYTRADLATADRHITMSERHIASQELVLTGLRMRGQDTEIAEALLSAFNVSMVEHRAHRAAIIHALEQAAL